MTYYFTVSGSGATDTNFLNVKHASNRLHQSDITSPITTR